jgi:hypothetical protein
MDLPSFGLRLSVIRKKRLTGTRLAGSLVQTSMAMVLTANRRDESDRKNAVK